MAPVCGIWHSGRILPGWGVGAFGAELQQAGALGLDYALLGHVQPTASHPGVTPLGWQGFAAVLADGIPLPVYALGGLKQQDLDEPASMAPTAWR
jgi:thiamine monophosphate synthase